MNTINLLVRLLIKQKRNYLKEILVGIVFSVLAIIIFMINQAIGNLILVSLLSIFSLSSFINNDIFWSVADFRSLNINPGTRKYFFLFLVQRLFRDSYISDLIVVVGLGGFLLLKYGLIQFSIFLIAVISTFLSTPAYSIMYEKKNIVANSISIIAIIILPITLWFDFIFIGCLSNIYKPLLYRDFLICFLGAIIWNVVIITVSTNITPYKRKKYLRRQILIGLKKVDIWLYKDYILHGKMIVYNSISLIIMMMIFANDEDDVFGILRPLLLWFVCSTQMASNKKEKQYTLIKDDPLFCGKNLGMNSRTIRKKKFMFIISAGLPKIIISIPFLIYAGFSDVKTIVIFVIGAFIASVLECYTIFKTRTSTKILISVVKVTIPILWICIIYMNYSETFLYIYLLTTLLISIIFLHDILNDKRETVL